MVGHAAVCDLSVDAGLAALLYHPRWPCANPGAMFKMNKQQAIRVRARPWLTD
jgi:hypothetical protein